MSDPTPEQAAHFVALVREMRRLQKRWFGGDRSTATLHDAKQAEKRVDRAIDDLENGHGQPGLF